MDTVDPQDAALVPLELTVNGDRVVRSVASSRTLLEVLRYELGLTGSKQGCDKGDCGACTVLSTARPCSPASRSRCEAAGYHGGDGGGPGRGATLHPVQDSFDRYGAAQCGFCTPGILMSAAVLLDSAQDGGNGAPRAYPRRDQARPLRQPLPLHRLHQDRRGGRGRGARSPARRRRDAGRERRRDARRKHKDDGAEPVSIIGKRLGQGRRPPMR